MPPDVRELERRLRRLGDDRHVRSVAADDGTVALRELTLEQVDALLATDEGALFLMAAAAVNRTDVKTGVGTGDALLVAAPLRRAFVVRSKLPERAVFETIVELALARRSSTLGRKEQAATEELFRERLKFEGVPLRMDGAWTSGLLVPRRKPDGIWPDPDTGVAPRLYLEIKKINRVSDDIQKRLYEIAEVSLEMKFIYGKLKLRGLDLTELLAEDARPKVRASLRRQIQSADPVVVALVLCPALQVEKAREYRPRAEAFIDRMFLPDEVDECISYLAEKTAPQV